MDKFVLIVAGGTGTRMNAGIPKQFLLLKGRPIVMHTIEKFIKYDRNVRIRLVLPEDQFITWEGLCNKYNFTIPHDLGIGGRTRFHSVKNNLSYIPDNCLIGIHDGVRPFVSLKTIERSFSGAIEMGNAIPCIRIPETLRKIESGGTVQVDRNKYRLIQTPQVFLSSVIKNAYLQEYDDSFTDDAGVIERAGYSVHLVEGNAENIKITFHTDLATAEALINRMNE